MNTIYVKQSVWETHAQERQMGRAVGETGRSAPVRLDTIIGSGREGKVVDLAAWKAENLVEFDEPEELESGLGSYEGRELVRRRRRSHTSAFRKGELAATLSVAGVMLAMILRVVVF